MGLLILPPGVIRAALARGGALAIDVAISSFNNAAWSLACGVATKDTVQEWLAICRLLVAQGQHPSLDAARSLVINLPQHPDLQALLNDLMARGSRGYQLGLLVRIEAVLGPLNPYSWWLRQRYAFSSVLNRTLSRLLSPDLITYVLRAV